MSLGFQNAGFNIAAAYDNWDKAVASAPVVDDAVSQVHSLSHHTVSELCFVIAVPCVTCAVDARRAVVMVRHQVVVERRTLAAPYAAISVLALAMTRIIKALRYGAPLHSEVSVVVVGSRLVDAPAERAMVQYDVIVLASPRGVGGLIDIFNLASADPDEPHNDVVRFVPEGVIAKRDAGSGSRLAGNSHVAGTDDELRLEVDVTGDIENNDSRTLSFKSLTKRALARIVEISDMDYLATPAASDSIARIAFSPRKRRSLGRSLKTEANGHG